MRVEKTRPLKRLNNDVEEVPADAVQAGKLTCYKHAHSRDLAGAVQRRLLQDSGLDDFGLVGNFKYARIRR